MTKLNHLAQETSPYLQQHANNPVDWYPWTEEVLEKARQENKPILLSIGYAACHWCHVMAHESFEDPETAKIMNDLFINIKVDREERPDLDKVYQTSHYLLTQHAGGWPLTIFLSPSDLTPFFSGTYFPKESRYQLPSFKEVLQTIADIFRKNAKDIKAQNEQLLKVLNYEIPSEKNLKINNEPIKSALQRLQQNFDTQSGGFGDAPKFPNPTRIEFLMLEKSRLASATLLHMAEGGIYDQIQGGFFRYSIDAKWQIPHFEKMLYDNAQLLFLYATGSHIYSNSYFATIAHETADWIISKMQSPEGGFYSSFDADSEGHEGKFYVWNKFEVQEILSEAEGIFVDLYFGLNTEPNFEKHWHLHVANPFDSVAQQLKLSQKEAEKLLRSIKKKILNARDSRIPPELDKKILTGWNGLMIKGMAVAGDILQAPQYLLAAQRALEFIQKHLWQNNRLMVSYKDGKAPLPAYLDDYAYLLESILTLLQISWNTKHLEFAIQLAENLLTLFYDKEHGGFFFTANNQKTILYRPKTTMDEAMPSGNSIALQSLLTLGHLLGETRYLDVVEKSFQAAWPALSQFPAEHCSLLMVLNNYLSPPKTIVIRGEKEEMSLWREFSKNQNYLRNEVFAIPDSETHLPLALPSRKSIGKTCAYVCQGTQCLSVIDSFVDLKKILEKND